LVEHKWAQRRCRAHRKARKVHTACSNWIRSANWRAKGMNRDVLCGKMMAKVDGEIGEKRGDEIGTHEVQMRNERPNKTR
jgi:hypothetical protein